MRAARFVAVSQSSTRTASKRPQTMDGTLLVKPWEYSRTCASFAVANRPRSGSMALAFPNGMKSNAAGRANRNTFVSLLSMMGSGNCAQPWSVVTVGHSRSCGLAFFDDPNYGGRTGDFVPAHRFSPAIQIGSQKALGMRIEISAVFRAREAVAL